MPTSPISGLRISGSFCSVENVSKGKRVPISLANSVSNLPTPKTGGCFSKSMAMKPLRYLFRNSHHGRRKQTGNCKFDSGFRVEGESSVMVVPDGVEAWLFLQDG